jgi:Icc-related predicted phosphoesterase
MRLVVSDTHTHHAQLGVLRGDVLIHCGDGALGRGQTRGEVEQLDRWFARQEFDSILAIGGNHDFEIEATVGRAERPFRHARYLRDEGVTFRGVRFYGAPRVPELAGWAFHLDAPALPGKWRAIPTDTDVLITHTPVCGILDRNSAGRQCGCRDLLATVVSLQPTLHCFGHIHANSGVFEQGATPFVNASMVNRAYEIAHRPREIDS